MSRYGIGYSLVTVDVRVIVNWEGNKECIPHSRFWISALFLQFVPLSSQSLEEL